MTKKISLIVIALTAVMLVSLLGSVIAYADPPDSKLEKPSAIKMVTAEGYSQVSDDRDDLILISPDCTAPGQAFSLPFQANGESPAYTDIICAHMHELGQGKVEMNINVVDNIPAEPTENFLSYGWMFEGGCMWEEEETVTDKYGLIVRWLGASSTWEALWINIEDCDNRIVIEGDHIDPEDFEIVRNRITVTVSVSDIFSITQGEGLELPWYAAVRRLPFNSQYEHTCPPNDPEGIMKTFTNTIPVDVTSEALDLSDPIAPAISHDKLSRHKIRYLKYASHLGK